MTGHAGFRSLVDSAEASVEAASQFISSVQSSFIPHSYDFPKSAGQQAPCPQILKSQGVLPGDTFTNKESVVRRIFYYYFTQAYTANMWWSQNVLSNVMMS